MSARRTCLVVGMLCLLMSACARERADVSLVAAGRRDGELIDCAELLGSEGDGLRVRSRVRRDPETRELTTCGGYVNLSVASEPVTLPRFLEAAVGKTDVELCMEYVGAGPDDQLIMRVVGIRVPEAWVWPEASR